MATNGHGRSDSERQKLTCEILECLPSLKGFAISLCGNTVRAEDLVQETVLRALANLDKFEPGTNMSAWLFTILRNHFRSEYRKHRYEVEDGEGKHAVTLVVPAGDVGAEHAADFNRLLQYIACLPAEQRDALIAVGYLGISYEEAADLFGCMVGTIKSRVNRARDEVFANMDGDLIKKLDLTPLRTATRGVPKTDPYYPLARALEELYGGLSDIGDKADKPTDGGKTSESELEWHKLVASGALDGDSDTFLQGTGDIEL